MDRPVVDVCVTVASTMSHYQLADEAADVQRITVNATRVYDKLVIMHVATTLRIRIFLFKCIRVGPRGLQ